MLLSLKVSSLRFSKLKFKALLIWAGRELPPNTWWRTGSHTIFLSLSLILESLHFPAQAIFYLFSV